MVSITTVTRLIKKCSTCSSSSSSSFVFLSTIRRTMSNSTIAATTQQNHHYNVDVLVVGGGVVGSTLVKLLQQRAPGCQIGLIDRAVPPTQSGDSGKEQQQKQLPQARAYALSPKSLSLYSSSSHENGKDTPSILKQLSKKKQLGIYDTMQIWESNSSATLLFSSQDDLIPHHEHNSILQDTSKDIFGVKKEDNKTPSYLGAVVEDKHLLEAIWGTFQQEQQSNTSKNNDLSIWAPANIQSIDDSTSNGSVRVTLQQVGDNGNDGDDGTVTTTTIDTQLLVAADGANSFVRNYNTLAGNDTDKLSTMSSIAWEGYEYGRMAMTCVVELDRPMPKRAFQRFLPYGPLALLPTWSPTHATVVWSTIPSHAKQMAAQQQKSSSSNHDHDDDVVQEINNVLQQGPSRTPPLFSSSSSIFQPLTNEIEKVIDTINYGFTMSHWTECNTTYFSPPQVQRIAGPKLTFPLTCKSASSYRNTNGRIVLVGDAAHTIHPMAGQGLNLGLGDVDVLSMEIAKAYTSGMDVSTFTTEYGTQRQRHVSFVQTGVHTLHQVFGMQSSQEHSQDHSLSATTTTTIPGIMTMKSLGMNFVNHAGPIRRQLAAIAAGIV